VRDVWESVARAESDSEAELTLHGIASSICESPRSELAVELGADARKDLVMRMKVRSESDIVC
jgi:hypothetical protein